MEPIGWSEIMTTDWESLIVYNKEQQPYVEVEISEQVFEKKNIELGVSNGLSVEILSGLTIADRIKKL